MSQGKKSIGVRKNKVCWFKGKIQKVSITPKVIDKKKLII
jgi:hypothetical protein